jgi:hypothetical protein
VIRRVAFGKAILAGAAGALAWEIAARILIAFGVPLFDLTKTLGTAVAPSAWWPVGLALHIGVGVIWAIFYCYFFWSTIKAAPVLQGFAFAILPTVLAGLVMVPQIGWMHPWVLSGRLPFPGLFAVNQGWGGPAGVVFGHAIYGLTMGAIYTHPVGYRAEAKTSYA